MRLSVITICVVAVILAMVYHSDARWWRKRYPCSKKTSRAAKPYYFGKTNLWCMMKYGKKGKRSAPKRHNLWSLSHSFIYYDGWYFEFGVGKTHKAVYNTRAVKSNRCKSRRDKKPAGYSTLSVECLKKCTKNYKGKYGKYRLLTHNCHHFANRISNILCNWKSCPSWCK
uniref:Uncharacterized protein n=1 Tax=Pinctada fucata TaxID=50426 RepID=A0A194ALC9_PINFU